MPEKRKKRDDFPWFEVSLVGGFFIIFIMPLLIGLAFFLFFQVFDLIYPGVYIGDTSVWGLTREKAELKVDRLWNEEHVLIVTDGHGEWPAPPADFGLWVSAEDAVQQAFEIGRGSDGLFEFLEMLTGETYIFEPQVLYYPEIAKVQLESWTEIINVEGYPTGVRYQSGEWVTVPGQDSISLDVSTTLENISLDPQAVIRSGILVLSTDREEYNVGDSLTIDERVKERLNKPLQVSAYDPITDTEQNWAVPRDVLAPMIQIAVTDELHPQINTDAFKSYLYDDLEKINSQWTVSPNINLDNLDESWQASGIYEVTVWNKPTEYTVQAGDSLNGLGLEHGMPYWRILEANPFLNDNGLHAGQVITIPSKNELLPLPVVREKRIEIDISQQRMRTFQSGSQLHEYIISTGIDSSPTHPGVFQIQTHELNAYASVWDLYMPHFLGIYEGWPGFMNGIHGLPMLSNGNRLWADVLGTPASYGCVILDLDDAEDLYSWADDGVIVEIIE